MRWRLGILALVALWPFQAGALQTFLPAGGYALSTSSEVQLEDLESAIVVSSTGASYFLLASIDASNYGGIDCGLRVELHNVSGAIPDGVVTSTIPGGMTRTVQVPINASGATFGLGPQIFQVFVTKTCNTSMSFAATSYLGIFNGEAPGGVIGTINGDGAFEQTLLVDSPATDLEITDDGSGQHTIHLHMNGAGSETVRIGNDATATQLGAISIGEGAANAGQKSILIGRNSVSNADNQVVIGENTGAGGEGTVGIGHLHGFNGTCDDGVIIGGGANCTGLHGIGIGFSAAPSASCIAIGSDATCGATGVITMGNVTDSWSDVFLVLGGRLSLPAPPDVEVVPSAATGTNIAGADMSIAGGNRTGNQLGGSILFRTSSAGTSGTGTGTLAERWRVTADGELRPLGNAVLDIGDSTHYVDDAFLDTVHTGALVDNTATWNLTGGDILPTVANQNIGELAQPVQQMWLTELHGVTFQFCGAIEDVSSADDDHAFWIAPYAVTLTSVACSCVGTCSTKADFTLADNAGNAMTISGSSPTCSTGSSNASYATISAGGGLVAGEQVRASVSNSPTSNQEHLLCITYVRP